MVSSSSGPQLERRIRNNIRRLEPPRRVPGIDLTRGLAILGMYLAHLTDVTPLEWSQPDTWLGVVEGRSAITFAMLAGVSLGLMGASWAGRLHQLQETIRLRALLIWVLGLLLMSLEVPIIIVLPTYALLLIAGSWLITWSTRSLLGAAAVLAVTMPFVVALIDSGGPPPRNSFAEFFTYAVGWNYPFILWLAYLAAGIGVGRLLRRGYESVIPLLMVGMSLCVLGYAVIGPIGNVAVERHGTNLTVGSGMWLLSVLQDQPHSHGVGEAIGSGGFSMVVIAVGVAVGSTMVRWLLWPLRVIGSMPLTAYTAHVVVWGVWIMTTPGVGRTVSPLSGFQALDPLWPITVWVIIGCAAWAVLWGQGPLERLVHGLSKPRETAAREQSRL